MPRNSRDGCESKSPKPYPATLHRCQTEQACPHSHGSALRVGFGIDPDGNRGALTESSAIVAILSNSSIDSAWISPTPRIEPGGVQRGSSLDRQTRGDVREHPASRPDKAHLPRRFPDQRLAPEKTPGCSGSGWPSRNSRFRSVGKSSAAASISPP